jgi:hypothetical protein
MDIQPVIVALLVALFAVAGLGYLWLKLTGQIPRHDLEDEMFGNIDYDYSGDKEGTPIWVGDAAWFEPTAATVFVMLAGDRSGPYNVGRQAYVELQRRYADIRPKIARFLVEQGSFLHPADPPVDPEALLDQISLRSVSVCLPTDSAKSLVEIELGFGVAWDADHSCDVLLRNWEPVELLMNG